MTILRVAPAMAGLLLALGACRDEPIDPDVVARAGSHMLRVNQVVELLLDQEQYPAQADVVEGLAELWTDYTLLATAAEADSTLRNVDLLPLVQQRIDQEMLFQLRDSAIQVDTTVTESDLRSRYEGDASDVRFRASHIMLGYPLQATPAQRDSVRDRLQALRGRIEAGASFADLARQFSQDGGTAAAGGDLGTFGTGEMVRPFEDAVLALEPGEVSDVVETPMGLHLIRLDERERVAFEAVAPDLRNRIRAERTTRAESLFVAGVEERGGEPALVDGALDVVRELARNPGTRLSGRAARRPLLEWSGGSLTAGRVLELLRFEEPGFHQQVVNSEDEALEGFLSTLARRELLTDEARRAGLAPPPETIDSLVAEASAQLRTAARRLGIFPLDRAPGERPEPAVARAVQGALAQNLSGATPPVPLGPIGYQLRSTTSHATFNAGIGRAVLRIGELRASRGPSAGEGAVGSPSPTDDPAGP